MKTNMELKLVDLLTLAAARAGWLYHRDTGEVQTEAGSVTWRPDRDIAQASELALCVLGEIHYQSSNVSCEELGMIISAPNLPATCREIVANVARVSLGVQIFPQPERCIEMVKMTAREMRAVGLPVPDSVPDDHVATQLNAAWDITEAEAEDHPVALVRLEKNVYALKPGPITAGELRRLGVVIGGGVQDYMVAGVVCEDCRTVEVNVIVERGVPYIDLKCWVSGKNGELLESV